MNIKRNFLMLKAFLLALKYHKGQKDKGGKPYILHPLKVAMKVKGPRLKTIALLHDIVEDTPLTVNALANVYKFPIEITWAVHAITKAPGEHRQAYLTRVRRNHMARAVKIEDIKHNMDLKRLKNITKRDLKRNLQYQKDLRFLEDNNFYM